MQGFMILANIGTEKDKYFTQREILTKSMELEM